MKSTMMHLPMTTQMIMRHGARIHSSSEIATYDGGNITRTSYSDVARRAAQLAAALVGLGVGPGDRVATLCWNHQQHFEAYLAVPGIGAVLHTLNIRLFAEQLAYIIDHAADRVLIIDASLLPLIADILPERKSLQTLIVIGWGAPPPPMIDAHDYETLIASAPPLENWPSLEEAQPAVACYTSGTTGNPKGVVYSHKTIFVHSLASLGVDTFGISQADRILLLPPMFHANAWGLPYSGWLAGSRFVMPKSFLQPEHVRRMITSERPTFTAMVPTLVNDLLLSHRDAPLDMSSFRVIVSGGSAVAPALIDRVRDTWGVPILQGWGMTETSPMCALSVPPVDAGPGDETHWRSSSGRPVPGIEVRAVGDDGRSVPNDGVAVGGLQLRGPWVACGYHALDDTETLSEDGWLRTGDVGSIDERGYVRITDRAKDVIKSGGEWISSLELEALLVRHERVVETAVIGVPDPRWEERPLALVVASGAVSSAELRAHLASSVARFWLPEYWAFVPDLPRTSVGKVDKKALRAMVNDGRIKPVRDDAAF